MEPSTGGAEPCGAYAILKRWYQYVSVWAPKPSRTDMENVRGNFQNLYHREDPNPPGLPLTTHVNPDKVNDKIPSEAELEAVVLCLRPHRSGGHTHLRAEHFKQWQRGVYLRDYSKTSPRRERWMCLVDIVQHMWSTGEIPQELGWTVLVLIPKGTTDTRFVGLLETLWKVVEALIDTRLCASL